MRVAELRAGESFAMQEDEAVAIVARGQNRKSLLEEVDPLFWDFEHDARKRTAFLEREMRGKIVAWRHDELTIERVGTPQGIGGVVYYIREYIRLYLLPNLHVSIQPCIYPSEVHAYERARKYIDFYKNCDRLSMMVDQILKKGVVEKQFNAGAGIEKASVDYGI